MWPTYHVLEIKQLWRICESIVWRISIEKWYFLENICPSHPSTKRIHREEESNFGRNGQVPNADQRSPTDVLGRSFYCSNNLLNLILTRVVIGMTQVDKSNGIKPYVVHLKTFWCVFWVHISDNYGNKLDSKSHTCIMISYSFESKSFQQLDPIKKKSFWAWIWYLMRIFNVISC